MDLREAVLAALEPRGVRERLRTRIAGGYTALQVYERLHPDARAALAGGDARAGVEAVHRTLRALATDGRVAHGRSSFGAELKGKGYRSVLVDVYRVR